MASSRQSIRLQWIDGMKGISILWIVFFHGFSFLEFPWPLSEGYFSKLRELCQPASAIAEVGCTIEAMAVAVVKFGFHAVAVFLVLSGFGLTYSLAKTGEPQGGWLGWYKSRVLRLFPMYWLAHIVYLVSPFQSRPEPIDYRFVLSFFGDRFYPIDMIFYYFNPALWYFGLLLQLYLVFPLLFRLLQRTGIGGLLVVAALITFACRYVLLCVMPVSGNYVQGGFFACRLWEFAFGMAAGWLYRKQPQTADRLLFSAAGLFAGAVIYVIGLRCYAPLWRYTFADAFTGTGLAILLAHVARGAERLPSIGTALATIGAYSYGLYLLHQPYVLYFCSRAQHLPTPGFLTVLVALMAVLTLASMAVERYVNQLTQRALA
jgi:peptidoglycan/LPS O-acetylase OafA/YrhL